MSGWRSELVVGQAEAVLDGVDSTLIVHGSPIDAKVEWEAGSGLTVGIRAGSEDDVAVDSETEVDARLVQHGIDPHDETWRVL